MEKITLPYDEYMKVWQILEELRVSLDRIGGYDEKEILKDKLFNYMTPSVYRKIAEAADILESHLPREKSIELANGFQYHVEDSENRRRENIMLS